MYKNVENWIRKDGYLTRGLPGGKPDPYECTTEEKLALPNENSERYWKAYGLERQAPIVDFEE